MKILFLPFFLATLNATNSKYDEGYLLVQRDELKATKTKNGYRQLGHVGNLVRAFSTVDCLRLTPDGSAGIGSAPADCLQENFKIIQQNDIQLARQVQQLIKRLNQLTRRNKKNMGYTKSEHDYSQRYPFRVYSKDLIILTHVPVNFFCNL